MYLYNIARVATATTGTGTVTLGAAEPTFLTFANAGVADGDVVTYVIENSAGREIGRGTYSSTGPTLSRDAVINSTNSNSLVTLIGSSTVSITAASVDLPLIASTNDFRLSSVSGNSNPTINQTAVTTIYLTPHKGSSIGLYDGTGWRVLNTSEVALSLAGLAANTNLDVFAYINAGSVSLATLAWTNDTTRASQLETQDGVLVLASNKTRRYVGTIRTTSSVGQTEDSNTIRYIWNNDNKIRRLLYRNLDYATASYQTPTWRRTNNVDTYKFDFVIGTRSSLVNVNLSVHAYGIGWATVALQIDTATYTLSSESVFASVASYATANAIWAGYPSPGSHYLQSFQRGGSGALFYGSGSIETNFPNCAMVGTIEC